MLTNVLVVHYPAGRVRARNSGQLWGLLHTSIRNYLATQSRRASRLRPLSQDPPEDRGGSREEEIPNLRRFIAARDPDGQLERLFSELYGHDGVLDAESRQELLVKFDCSQATLYRQIRTLKTIVEEYLREY